MMTILLGKAHTHTALLSWSLYWQIFLKTDFLGNVIGVSVMHGWVMHVKVQ